MVVGKLVSQIEVSLHSILNSVAKLESSGYCMFSKDIAIGVSIFTLKLKFNELADRSSQTEKEEIQSSKRSLLPQRPHKQTCRII